MTKSIDFEGAIEAFARGWSRVRSRTRAQEAVRVDGLWLTRDGPEQSGRRRNEELITHGIPPARVDRIARQRTQGRYRVSDIRKQDEPEEPLRSAYRALGYRLLATEGFFVHSLRRIRASRAPVEALRVNTAELVAAVTKASGRRKLGAEDLVAPSPTIRLYAALDGERVVGWVSSVTAGEAAWCSDLYVLPSHRRRGIARALMARMLREDRSLGFTASVLTASHTGALLYPVLGYERIGELYLYAPSRAAR